MTRFDEWPKLLAEYIEERRNVPFEWEVQDCCSFAAEWVRRATGRDVFTPWRGQYSTRWGALRYIIGAGGVGRFPGSVGLTSCRLKHIQRGDIAGVTTAKGLALGVCVGARVAAPGVKGLEFLKMNRVRFGWKV